MRIERSTVFGHVLCVVDRLLEVTCEVVGESYACEFDKRWECGERIL